MSVELIPYPEDQEDHTRSRTTPGTIERLGGSSINNTPSERGSDVTDRDAILDLANQMHARRWAAAREEGAPVEVLKGIVADHQLLVERINSLPPDSLVFKAIT